MSPVSGRGLLKSSAFIRAKETLLSYQQPLREQELLSHYWILRRHGAFPTEPLSFGDVWNAIAVYRSMSAQTAD